MTFSIMCGPLDMANSKIKFILASASPRRKELIGHLGIPFEIRTKNILEESPSEDPVQFCSDIAADKGRAVLEDLKSSVEELFVVSADTIVCLNDKIFGKPQDVTQARRFLLELAGKTHSVFTAVSVIHWSPKSEQTFFFVEESKVSFNPIPDVLMEKYLATGDSLDKAGAYGIQGPSLTFISKVEGCYANVVGFPLSRFVVESEKYFKTHLQGKSSWPELF
jgi:septum formation protein